MCHLTQNDQKKLIKVFEYSEKILHYDGIKKIKMWQKFFLHFYEV